MLGEIEKDVILSGSQAPSPRPEVESMAVDLQQNVVGGGVDGGLAESSSSEVIKVIKKTDVEVLCSQHNPVSYKSSCFLV